MPNNKTKKTEKPKEKTAIQKTHESALSEIKELKLTEETVLRHLNQYASKQEIAMFLNQCKMFDLNPFKREIYLIKYSQSAPATYVLGFEAFLKRAERAGRTTGWRAWTEGTIKTKDFKAIIEIHRKDWDKPFVHEVFWDEYAQKKGDGTYTKFWDDKPRTMLKKVAISQGFRMCFPDELGGMPYTAEEMPVDTSTLKTEPIIDAEIVKDEEEKPEPKKETKKKEEPKEKPKEEELNAPEVETSDEPDAPPEPEEEEPEAPPEEEKEKPNPDPGDPITDQTKGFVANALSELEKDFGRDPTEIGNKIADRIEGLFKSKVEKFPDDLTEYQGKKVLKWLAVTKGREEEKKGL